MKDHLILRVLFIIAILLPIGSMFLFLFARLLALFGDPVSTRILDGAGIVFATLWIIDFVALVFGVTYRMILADEKK
ncbi:MAG: hypothetical protein FWC43_08880 [Planctomycetaceae bacterium]|nr:hypothetical protein [Planctomycetaceae bacterium]